ncbi:hypothetical protein LCGC14_1167730 [marine sediment metagenome]|uniref:Uncharacterized protein n=1 Tax=marine sediment metagenome TaxID=412755 RepID=A0A0F9LVN5_9ZZZZ
MTACPRRRLRYIIIRRLNKRADTCWADLVCWAEFAPWRELWAYMPWQGWLRLGTAIGCRREARLKGACYCAKFATQRELDRYGDDFTPLFILDGQLGPEDEDVMLVFK